MKNMKDLTKEKMLKINYSKLLGPFNNLQVKIMIKKKLICVFEKQKNKKQNKTNNYTFFTKILFS